MADQNTITAAAAITSEVSADYQKAMAIRLPNRVNAINDNTRLVVTTSDGLEANTAKLMTLYNKGGIIAVIAPKKSVVQTWLTTQGINLMLPDDIEKESLFAFNNGGDLFSMSALSDNSDINEHLNPFTAWANDQLRVELTSDPGYTTNDVTKLFDRQTIVRTYDFTLSKEITHVLWSTPDVISGKGQLVLTYNIYPLYAFEGQGSSSGDYYIVDASVKVLSEGMYAGNLWKKHGGVKARYCGFYLRSFAASTSIAQPTSLSEIPDAAFAAGCEPTPKTTSGQTTYESGMTWNINASVTGGINKKGPSAEVTLEGGVSFTNKQSRTVSDVDIHNNSNSTKASYRFTFNNLPKYNAGTIAITDPTTLSTSGAEFHQSWIWHVPGTHDNAVNSYTLAMTIDELTYGACYFYSTGADFNNLSFNIDDLIPGSTLKISNIAAPNRIPTGRIKIVNTMDNKYVSDFVIKNYPSGTTYQCDYTNSYAPQQTNVLNIPVGKYTIEFKGGTTASDRIPYKLSKPYIEIERGAESEMHTSYDFVAK